MRFIKLLLIASILSCLILPVNAAYSWTSNSTIISGLPDIGSNSAPAVFNYSNRLILISGEEDGTFTGYDWTGSSWVSNASVVDGLGDVGTRSRPSIFNDSGSFKLITGRNAGTFAGYDWTGSSWSSNASVVAGLGDIGIESSATIFNYNGNLRLIAATGFSVYYGYEWNGSSWVSNASIVDGIGSVSSSAVPFVFNNEIKYKLILGRYSGTFAGYDWNGSSWKPDTNLVAGLADVGTKSHPVVFKVDGVYKLISGESDGPFNGYTLTNSNPTVPTNQTDLGNNLIDHTPTITWTNGTDADNDTITTYIFAGTTSTSTTIEGFTSSSSTFNIGTNVTLSDGQTYYYRLRSWDGLLWSDYTTSDTFRMNTPPPAPILISTSGYHNNATINMTWETPTDAEGDSLYYDVKVGTTPNGTDVLNEVVASNVSSLFSVSQFNTYYFNVRSNDSYEFSGWGTESSFGFLNELPIISNITIFPDPIAIEDDLTVVNDTATDADGDPITLYYKWYKNGVHQSL